VNKASQLSAWHVSATGSHLHFVLKMPSAGMQKGTSSMSLEEGWFWLEFLLMLGSSGRRLLWISNAIVVIVRENKEIFSDITERDE